MTIKKDIDTFEELYKVSWSGASDVLQRAEEVGREEEVMEHLEEVFADAIPTETELNDYIWFELDNELNLWNEGEEEEEGDF